MTLVCESCIKQSPIISPFWYMFEHKIGVDAICSMCKEVRECVDIPVPTRGPQPIGADGSNPFPERTAEELAGDCYLMAFEMQTISAFLLMKAEGLCKRLGIEPPNPFQL